jgi:hypothetical protein
LPGVFIYFILLFLFLFILFFYFFIYFLFLLFLSFGFILAAQIDWHNILTLFFCLLYL